MTEAPEGCRLYLISPPSFVLPEFTAQLKDAFAGGDIGCFQLRMKDASEKDIRAAADALLPICHEHEAAFIMNDSARLAKICGADGVHLGEGDGDIIQVREEVGEEFIIGASCYNSHEAAMDAGDFGADYVAFGAFYPTTTKVAKSKAELEILEWWSTYTVLPCVAIGGINANNCAPLVQAGADFIAAISAVWQHPKGPSAGVAALNAAINKA